MEKLEYCHPLKKFGKRQMDQKESFIMWCQGSFALLKCFFSAGVILCGVLLWAALKRRWCVGSRRRDTPPSPIITKSSGSGEWSWSMLFYNSIWRLTATGSCVAICRLQRWTSAVPGTILLQIWIIQHFVIDFHLKLNSSNRHRQQKCNLDFCVKNV